MRFLDRLLSATRDPREPVRPLWQRVVEQARAPEWYRDGGVADTLEGRFDMVTLVLALVVLRMERSAMLTPQTAPLTEIFVEEMDGQLRQSGVGDLMVGKQIGRLMATLGGRMGALRTALAVPGDELGQVIARNVTLNDAADIGEIAARLRALAVRLDATADAALMTGEIA
jgi:cytochrome b pre-mRNA-processing protein 3